MSIVNRAGPPLLDITVCCMLSGVWYVEQALLVLSALRQLTQIIYTFPVHFNDLGVAA